MEKDIFGIEQKQFRTKEQRRQQDNKLLPVQNIKDVKKIVQNYQFFLNHIIRKNKFSQIYSGKQINQHYRVAIKVIPIQKTFTVKQRQQIQNQINKCNFLAGHKNIVSVFDIFCTSNNYYIMMEQCQTDLKKLLQKKKIFTEEQIIPIMLDILDGIRHFYSNNLIHCDIKPSNILITADGTCKITDLSLTRKQKSNPTTTKQDYQSDQWTPYMSPLTLVTKTFHQNNDAWSFAIIVYECLNGYQKYPWKVQSYDHLLQSIYQGAVYYSRKVSTQMTDFLNRCFMPKNNISLQDLYNDPFIIQLLQRKDKLCIQRKNQVQIPKDEYAYTRKHNTPQNFQLQGYNHQPNISQYKHVQFHNKNSQYSQIYPMQIKKTNSNYETLQSPTKNLANENRNKRVSLEQILQSQFSFMRFINIVLKQDQKTNNGKKQDKTYAEIEQKMKLDHKFFRFVLIKQNLIQRQSLKLTLNPYRQQNPFNISNLQQLFQTPEKRDFINNFKTKLQQYDKKYQPLQKQMQILAFELNQKLTKIRPQWRPRDILNLNMQRKQIFAILGVRLSRQNCIKLWRQIQLSLSMVQYPQFQLTQSHRNHLVGQIKQKLLRIDFLMSYYIINCLLIDDFSDPEYFTINCGLKIIMKVLPQWPQIQHVPLIYQKLQKLQIF